MAIIRLLATALALLLCSVSLSWAQDAEVGCYEEGECLGAGFADFLPLESVEECHRLCIDTDGCRFFTHYGETQEDAGCFAYLNCPDFSDAGCTDCISGEVECQVAGNCEIEGRCLGEEVDFITGVFSPEDCALECYCNSECVWWSHDLEFDQCILTADCPDVDDGCGTCVSGQSGCDLEDDVEIECGGDGGDDTTTEEPNEETTVTDGLPGCDSPPPPTDPDIQISALISCGEEYAGDTTDIPLDSTLPECDVDFDSAPTLWVKFSDAETVFSSVLFDTCVHGIDTVLGVFSDRDCDGELECVGGNDDASSSIIDDDCGFGSAYLVEGPGLQTTYYLAVSGLQSLEEGTFTLRATCS